MTLASLLAKQLCLVYNSCMSAVYFDRFNVLLKIDGAITDAQFQSILKEDDMLDLLSNVGYKIVPSRETLECMEKLVR